MMTVVGRGGVGKTAMVCRLLRSLEGGRLPDDGGALAVDGIVYLSSRAWHPVKFPYVFSDLCRLLPEDVAEAAARSGTVILEAEPRGADAGAAGCISRAAAPSFCWTTSRMSLTPRPMR